MKTIVHFFQTCLLKVSLTFFPFRLEVDAWRYPAQGVPVPLDDMLAGKWEAADREERPIPKIIKSLLQDFGHRILNHNARFYI